MKEGPDDFMVYRLRSSPVWRSTSTRCKLLGVAGAVAFVVAGCGGGDGDSTTQSRTSTEKANNTKSTTTGAPNGKQAAGHTTVAAVQRKFQRCSSTGGADLTKKVSPQYKSALSLANRPFAIQFSAKKFGSSIDDAAVLLFRTPAKRDRALSDIRKVVGKERRVVAQANLLVVFGPHANQKALQLVIKCARVAES
jgi:hypothetical protein